MTESNREHLSCLMDGELDRSAQKFLFRRLSGDSDLGGRWRRYHLVRACIHQEFARAGDLTDRVAAALADEPAPRPERAFERWLKPVAGGAIAASVALVALVGINANLGDRGSEMAADEPGFVSQPTSLDRTFSRQAVPVSYSDSSQADRQRINTYVLRHNQAVGGGGFASYVPIVTNSVSEARPAEPAETAESDQDKASAAGR